MKIIKRFIGIGLKISMWMVGVLLFLSCCGSFFTLMLINQGSLESQKVVNGQDYGHEDVAKLVFADNVDQLQMTQNAHPDGFSNGMGGYDYTTFCGDSLYSPVAGSAVVTYNGFDGVFPDNTMLTIVGKAGEANLLHGNFDDVRVGDVVVGGVTKVGTNASRGNSTGCHSHINWKPSEIFFVQNENLKRNDVQHTGKSGNHGSVLTNYNNVKLRVSHYIPANGGTNCDSDCTTMSSGDKVAHWIGGRNGIQASACPQEWVQGTRFMLSGQVYECRDYGGWINCYDKGDYDPALKQMATEQYCWVDLLSDGNGYAYGDFAIDWNFVK